ncbi:HD domain-containing protein [Micromonospora sp. NPDC049836]|uniref:HD domain-containing protein n=1 Tax=Micromonospora sp. NPDC049836 TaxID=3364274 RepID=UPI00379796F9
MNTYRVSLVSYRLSIGKAEAARTTSARVATLGPVIFDALRRALTAPDPPLRPLPDHVVDLLVALHAPPRLAAHLRAVHDVAAQVVDAAAERLPQLAVDPAAVLFGAATHDIGKVEHPAELSGSGSAHEAAGRELLLRHGIPAPLARFAAQTITRWPPRVHLVHQQDLGRRLPYQPESCTSSSRASTT